MNNLENIKQMDLSHRIYLMEELWNSFKYEQDSITSPQWHKDILDNRKRAYINGEIKTKSLNEVKKCFNK